MRIELVGEADLADLLPMMRAYCDFYEVAPSDAGLEALVRALIADPDREGIQLLARGDGGEPLGFATVFWSWQTLNAARAAVMNDLFVVPETRKQGVGRALIEECRRRAGERDATELVWETALDNETAQRLYRSVDARESRWLSYSLEV
ncbi:MAG TPA: GNAT family N-acetyltransferase [Solirubrobacterales bacterium]|jgi:ribosomal protein S18 acetylase RimI-like enzyme